MNAATGVDAYSPIGYRTGDRRKFRPQRINEIFAAPFVVHDGALAIARRPMCETRLALCVTMPSWADYPGKKSAAADDAVRYCYFSAGI